MLKSGWLVGLCCFLLSLSQISFANTLTEREKMRLCRCTQDQSCWPSEKAWTKFKLKLTGRLTIPESPTTACANDENSDACAKALTNLHNPFTNEQSASGTQSQGWFNAWQNRASVYAVEAETPEDVANAIKFARANKIRLIVKGTGHDYLGRSNAADSLMVWTHKMRAVTYHDLFTPAGCTKKQYSGEAVTVGAGSRWLDVYQEVTNKHHRYVQGGGCTTVGAAGGFSQGGGFGSFSKRYGTAASNMLQAEIVLANGKIVIANECQNEDLFWAIKGGGGSTFGIVTSMTFDTHPLPKKVGVIKGTITAKSDDAYRILLEQFLVFFRQYLNNDHWGEQFSFDKENEINLKLVFLDLDKEEVGKVWQPLTSWLMQHADSYSYNIDSLEVPPEKLWDAKFWQKNYPDMVSVNSQKNANSGEFWWMGDGEQIGTYWYTYQTWWLPLSLLEDEKIKVLANMIFKASRLAPLSMHMNKGLAGASLAALKRSRNTATNANMLQAAALITMTASDDSVYPNVAGHEPDPAIAKESVDKINQAMQSFYKIAPESGTYVNEADYFQKNWQQSFWGDNYARLAEIKHQYDPEGFFYCHHCVGSEMWQEGGMCKKS